MFCPSRPKHKEDMFCNIRDFFSTAIHKQNTCFLTAIYKEDVLPQLFAGEVIRHNVCKRHGSLTLVSNKLDQRHFSTLFQWDKKE